MAIDIKAAIAEAAKKKTNKEVKVEVPDSAAMATSSSSGA
jgi:hypothetical protein